MLLTELLSFPGKRPAYRQVVPQLFQVLFVIFTLEESPLLELSIFGADYLYPLGLHKVWDIKYLLI